MRAFFLEKIVHPLRSLLPNKWPLLHSTSFFQVHTEKIEPTCVLRHSLPIAEHSARRRRRSLAIANANKLNLHGADASCKATGMTCRCRGDVMRLAVPDPKLVFRNGAVNTFSLGTIFRSQHRYLFAVVPIFFLRRSANLFFSFFFFSFSQTCETGKAVAE